MKQYALEQINNYSYTIINKSEMSTSVHDLIDFSKLDLVPYQSPISPKHFSRLAFNTLFVAFVIMAWFIM